jgi:hypothetical protein
MKKQRAKTRRIVTLILPRSMRRPVASTLAPDLFEVGAHGKRLKRGRSIMDFMPAAKRTRKSTGSSR